MLRNLIIVVIGVFPLQPVFADVLDRATSSFSHELAECAAFSLLGAEAVGRNGNEQLKGSLNESALLASKLSINLSSEKVFKARVGMAVDEQKKIIGNDFSNISLLLQKYKDVCREAVRNPKTRFNYWVNKSRH